MLQIHSRGAPWLAQRSERLPRPAKEEVLLVPRDGRAGVHDFLELSYTHRTSRARQSLYLWYGTAAYCSQRVWLQPVLRGGPRCRPRNAATAHCRTTAREKRAAPILLKAC